MARRLAIAFAAVAVLAVGVLGALTWVTTSSQVSDLVRSRNAATGSDVAAALGDGYTAAGSSWQNANLRVAYMLAASASASLVVQDANGATVGPPGFTPPMMRVAPTGPVGAPQDVPVVVNGRRVGTAVLRFPVETPAAEQQVASALGQAVLWGSALAAALAAVLGLLVARRIARPLRQLTAAARSLTAGELSARAGGSDEPAELGELARAFDRMAETIEREDELRRAFAADVAHELRTPLAIAQGELEALVDGIERPTPERLRSLHEEMLRLARIVQDVETLAAAEASQFRLERRRLDFAEVARDGVAALHGQADAANLKVTTELQPTFVDADRARLEQVVRNLLGNALKFTPAGGNVRVLVAAANGHAQLTVEDSGPGIADDELPHLFERFWRGRSGRDATGSGVGLAVVAELVRAHGGRVEASARPGGGARFTVSLPNA
jgi:signal transduction histidine kinase